ncbi:MAG TPA: GNAT family N-acetyltransferase [Alphaproteobacteria bacterium]|nr:GNAT family N-acetyltransferase [Alphaproteobacteria bacterium]
MPDTDPQTVTLRIETDIAAIAPADWDACAGPDNPFVSHAFLAALEDSGSAAKHTGWQPQHLIMQDDAKQLLGVVPAYVKSHSYGEYVFDHGWAQAIERVGGRYYPKLQVSVPFTPATGPRLLVPPGGNASALRGALIEGLSAVAENRGLSSVHATFLEAQDREAFEDAGWMIRAGCQYHWQNDGYGSFDDFLGALSSRKRKDIRKERRQVAEAGIEMVTLTGGDLKPEHWDVFYRFYMDTSDRKWGSPYLTRDFFQQIGRTMPDRIVLIMARHEGKWVAGALNLLGSEALYGRNWGCSADFRFLHFETCYYQAIEFAIARGLARVEAGAQGEHKIQRGYLPVRMESAHWIEHAGLRNAIDQFLTQERAAMEHHMAMLAEHSPFRHGERTDR